MTSEDGKEKCVNNRVSRVALLSISHTMLRSQASDE